MKNNARITEVPGPLFPSSWHFYNRTHQLGHWLSRLPLGFRLLFWCCGQRWFQQQFDPDIAQLNRFLVEAQLVKAAPATVVQQSLAGHIWWAWWHDRLQHCTQTEFEQQVIIRGLAEFQARYQRGQGVLLIGYHSIFAPLIEPFLRLYGPKNYTIIGATNAVLPAKGEKITPENEMMEHSRQLMSAKKVLSEGGIAFMLPDGLRGRGGKPIAFYNRLRPFRPAFAELALMGKAEIVPIVYSLTAHGKFQIDLLEPFDNPASVNKTSERIEKLCEQYIAFLTQQWEKPWQFYLRNLMKHLDLPPVASVLPHA